MPTDYRIAPTMAARLMGAILVGVSVLVFLATLLVVVLDLHTAVLAVPVALALGFFIAAAVLHRRRGWVMRLTEDGYRVQWIRGAGVTSARWKDVEDAVTDTVAGSPVVILRLRDGRTTTVPVEMLAGRPDAFVRDLQAHLQRGHGLRRL